MELISLAHQVEMALRERPTGVPQLEAALQLAAPPLPGSPQARWLLVVLHQHLRRQAWVQEVVTRHLGGDPEQIGNAGAFGHPEDQPHTGRVPGLDDWEYCFHGRGCCLTHRNGTVLDVDFHAVSATPEARAALLTLLQMKPPPGPEPQGQKIEFMGRERTVYSFAEMLEATTPVRTTDAWHRFRVQYQPLVKRYVDL